MSNPYLRPCPICGSEVHISASSDGYGVECASDGCFALAMDRFFTPELASQYWNTRSERYMELPVDADGVPVRVGDKMQYHGGEPFTVCAVAPGVIHAWAAVKLGERCTTCHYAPDQCTHYKPRTLEDVLEEFAHKAVRIGMAGGIPGDAEFYADKDAIAEYAAEIRELMEVDE